MGLGEAVAHDCRGDAGALYHQFGVTLRHVFDTQVSPQGGRDVRCPPLSLSLLIPVSLLRPLSFSTHRD
ncbi:hypothetical protein E2C01_080001 [Portunus trituberculatus]|uniref:Uncharacterized protein n=1 Tax=Portunus trituberculatus TaxID=210409 RepID=A0A5B7IUU0_PORTR|nr:hypothetical protein [Portunus trituberculatus]